MKKILTKTGSFFKKAWLWLKNHAPTRRRIIQLYAALLTNANIKGLFSGSIYTGNTKYACVPGLNCYSCPSTVGACPLGALQNALAGSGTKTPVYVLGIIALFAMMLGRTICGFLCPTGLIQDLLYKIKTRKLRKNRITRILSYTKYILLVVLVIAVPLAFMLQNTPAPGFCKYICPSGTLGGAIMLLINPFNADMFGGLGWLFTWKFCVLVVILLASVFMYRPFCRFLCPLGAIYGFFNRIALLGVKVEKDKCVDCGLCVAHCKMDIRNVGDHECINCGECIKVCPTKAIVWKGSSIFVKPSQPDDDLTVKVPLTNFVKPLPANATAGTGNGAALMQAVAAAESGEETSADMADMMAIEGTPSSPAVQSAAAAQPMRNVGRTKLYINEGGKKILQIVACVLAGLLLIGAIVYYNFFDNSATQRVDGSTLVGSESPDFSLSVMYGEDEGQTYNVADSRGKITILNFWYTTCTGCIAELPSFARFAEDYADSVELYAIQASFEPVGTGQQFITDMGWNEWQITFLHDSVQQSTDSTVYYMFGGNGGYPTTIILDEEGIVRSVEPRELSYEELESMVQAILDD